MVRRDDERAVSVQVGAVLLLAIIVSAMALWQATVVPQENSDIEYTHNQQVQDELLDLRNGIVSGGSGGSYSVALGVSYPSRTMFINPPDARGSLELVGTDDDSIAVTIENATARDADVAAFWDGDPVDFETGAIVYQPEYNEYANAPATIYENSVLYNRHVNDATIERSGQRLVDGSQLSLVSLVGTYSERGQTASMDLSRPSSSETTIDVRNDNDPVTLTVPTGLTAEKWEELLRDEGQWHDQNGHVIAVESAGTASVDGVTTEFVEIQLEPSVTYTLEMAKVGIGTNVEAETTAYVTRVSGDDPTLEPGEDHEFVVEVRDRFNNPVSDVTVNASADVSTVESTASTGSDGRASFVYNSSVETDEAEITMNVSPNPTHWEEVTFTATVTSEGQGDGGTYSIEWDREEIGSQSGIDCDDDRCTYNVGVEQADLTIGSSPAIAGASVDYSIQDDADVTTFDPTSGETDSAGENVTTLYNDDAEDGDEVIVHANSGGSGQTLVVEFESGDYFNVTVIGTNSPVQAGENLTVDVIIENIGDQTAEQDIVFDFGDDGSIAETESLELDGGASESITFEYDTSGEDTGTYDVRVASEDTSMTESITISEDLPTIDHRIEDLSHEDSDTPEYETAYTVDNTNDSFVRVDVVYENVDDSSATATTSSTETRDTLEYSHGYGYGNDYEIAIEVIYEDSDGAEYVIQDKTISDTANTVNPGNNDELGTDSSPEITAFNVDDRSNQGQGPRFDVEFDLSTESDFTEAQLLAIGQGPADIDRRTETTDGSYELNPDDGLDEEFVIVVLVYDSDGVIVADRRTTVTATA